jgi:alpha-methylacyl-CoA racemase
VSGPLAGVRLIELAGLGPVPFAGMMLADAGADIIRIDRSDWAAHLRPGQPPAPAEPGNPGEPPQPDEPDSDLLNRGRRSVAVDLKQPAGAELVLRLAGQADGLMEGFRPGVAERLGIGPDLCLSRNPALVYGRMTGWGQSGPMAKMAGHDIDYIALAGALGQIGRAGEPPVPPLNLVGDFGGGGMMLAFGMVSAIYSARQTGQGQVIDAAMVDGAAALMAMTYTFRTTGVWKDPRGTNFLDTGAHFYEVYETSDGGYIAVGAIEPQFYAELLRLLGLDVSDLPGQMDKTAWPEMKRLFAAVFAMKTRDEWAARFAGTDACAAPVLSMDEAPSHPHNVHRQTFVEVAGVVQPAPVPRFSRTPGTIRRPPPRPGQGADEALADWGLDDGEVRQLRKSGIIG